MKILHIDSSIQGAASASRALSAATIERLLAEHPGADVTYRDLAVEPPPHLNSDGLMTVTSNAALREFLAADVVVIGAPMYNFSLASQLKSWIDHVLVAGQTFKYGPEGAIGLAAGKRVIVAHSRGGIYSDAAAAASEHAESYLRAVLGFIGIADPVFVVAEGIAYGPEQRDAALAAAQSKIGELALDDPAPLAK